MAHCPHCDYPLPGDRQRLGARCPNCRDPLYEPPGRFCRPARPEEGACAVHTGVEAVGACGKCGKLMCETCRTPYRNRIVCTACIEQALESGEAASEQGRSLWRQAMLSLGLGVLAWLVPLLYYFGIQGAWESDQPLPRAWALLAVLVTLASFLPAVFGLGLATASVRTRGAHTIPATLGLILGGAYAGTLLGILVLGAWVM